MPDQPHNPGELVVVTGAAGFIGRRVTTRLASTGRAVLALDRAADPGGWPTGVEYRRTDLAEGMPAHTGNWTLVHLAWNMDRGNRQAQDASLAVFARLLGQTGLTQVIGLGSAEEYGGLEGVLSEDTAPGPELSHYGAAKHRACRALDAWARQGERNAVWLRPFVVYGPGQGGNMAIPYAVRQARTRQPADFSEGSQQRDFVHVDDVADGIARAACRRPAASAPFAVLNLGRGEPVRLRDVLERIAVNMQAEERFRFGARPMRPGEPGRQVADLAAVHRVLDWKAAVSWREGIDRLCAEAAE